MMGKVAKAVKKAGKQIEKGVKTGAKTVERQGKAALSGDLKAAANLISFGVVDTFEKGHKELLRPAKNTLVPKIPDIPSAADIAGQIDIPEPQSSGAIQANIGREAPDIDLGFTEGKRRRSGSARGSRKLRVPLGGL